MTNKPPATEGQAAGLAEFVLVPREPTPEWIKDMDVHLLSKYGAELGPAVAREMIANVLAAAPSSASSGETGKPRAIANRMREIIQDVWDKKEGYTDRQAWSDLHGQALQLLGWEVASREALATPEQKPVMVLVTEAMVERLAVELARASLAEALPDREEVPMALVEPVIANYRNVARKALEATLSVPAAEQKAEPVARKRFPILKGDGATIDWQLVEDHGGQAQQNHYQTVHRLAERGGLSWSELHAVLHNQRYRDMDANEAMLACRALEARYLAAIAPSTQAIEARNAVVETRDERQKRVVEWCAAAFGTEHQASVPQRGLRMLEEAIEAYQALDGSPEAAHKLIDYIYAKEPGKLFQELGGLGITVLALAAAADLSADDAEKAELARVLSKPLEWFYARNEAKNAAGFDATAFPTEPRP